MTTSSNISSLRKDYERKAEKAKNYKRANFIFDLNDADTHYLNLLISRDEAYAEWKKAELGEKYHSLEGVRVNHRLSNYRKLLSLTRSGSSC